MWVKGVALLFTKGIAVLEGSKRKGESSPALFPLKRERFIRADSPLSWHSYANQSESPVPAWAGGDF